MQSRGCHLPHGFLSSNTRCSFTVGRCMHGCQQLQALFSSRACSFSSLLASCSSNTWRAWLRPMVASSGASGTVRGVSEGCTATGTARMTGRACRYTAPVRGHLPVPPAVSHARVSGSCEQLDMRLGPAFQKPHLELCLPSGPGFLLPELPLPLCLPLGVATLGLQVEGFRHGDGRVGRCCSHRAGVRHSSCHRLCLELTLGLLGSLLGSPLCLQSLLPGLPAAQAWVDMWLHDTANS